MKKSDVNKMLKTETEFSKLIISMAAELMRLRKNVNELMKESDDKRKAPKSII